MDKINIPEWMRVEEQYEPPKDKDGYISRSLLQVMGVLRRTNNNGRAGMISAPVFLLFNIYTIVLMSLSRNMMFTYIILAGLLLRIAMLQGREIIVILRGALFATILSALVLIPAIFLGNPGSMLTISIKVFVSVGLMLLMAISTSWNKLTSGMRFFKIPHLFIFTLDITLKYIVMLSETAVNMLTALKVRAIGKNANKDKSLGGILGVTFLKSKDMADETYNAMVCRGFDGTYHMSKSERPITYVDMIPVILMVIMTYMYIRFR